MAIRDPRGLLTTSAPFTFKPLSSQSRAFKSNKSTAFGFWRYLLGEVVFL